MSDLYYVKVQCNNITFKALVDSGAQISIISPSMLQKLGIHTNLNTIGYVHGIGQDKMMGNVDCQLKLQSSHKDYLKVNVHFTIVLNANLIILGLDFLEKYQCIINCYNKVLYLQQYQIPLYNKYNKVLTKRPVKKINK